MGSLHFNFWSIMQFTFINSLKLVILICCKHRIFCDLFHVKENDSMNKNEENVKKKKTGKNYLNFFNLTGI